MFQSARVCTSPSSAGKQLRCICLATPSPATLCSVQAGRYAAGVKRFDFDAGLGPYDLHRFAQWQRLSGFISDGDAWLNWASTGGSITFIFQRIFRCLSPMLGGAHTLRPALSSLCRSVTLCMVWLAVTLQLACDLTVHSALMDTGAPSRSISFHFVL